MSLAESHRHGSRKHLRIRIINRENGIQHTPGILEIQQTYFHYERYEIVCAPPLLGGKSARINGDGPPQSISEWIQMRAYMCAQPADDRHQVRQVQAVTTMIYWHRLQEE